MASKLTLGGAQGAADKKKLNHEWVVIANEGDALFNAEGCAITVGPKGKSRPRAVTTISAGLVLQPGERVRLVSGSPGKRSQGAPPAEEEGLRNFHLFLKARYLDRTNVVVRLVNRQQVELCSTVFEGRV